MRLAVWTAQNDFREACKSEIEIGLQQSAACNRTLAQPAQPPPIMKRTVSDMEGKDISRELAPWVAATCFALLLALFNGLRNSTVQQGVSATRSLSLAQLLEAVIEQSESNPQAIITLRELYLWRERFGPESDSARVVREYSDALIRVAAHQYSSIKTDSHAITHMESREGGSKESELEEIEHTVNPLSPSSPTQSAEPPNATTQDGTEIEMDGKPAESITAPAFALAAPSPTTATADSNTSADIASSSATADSSTEGNTEGRKLIPAVITTATARSEAPLYPQPETTMKLDALKPWQVLLNYIVTLQFGGILTSLLVLTPHGCVAFSAQLATVVVCFFVSRSLHGRQMARRWDRTLNVCVNRLLLFAIYAGLRRVLPSDTLTYKVLAWVIDTGLCTWMLVVFGVVHAIDDIRQPEISISFLRR